MISSNQNQKEFRVGSAPVKKILIWACSIVLVLVFLILGILYLEKKSPPLTAPQILQEETNKQLSELDALKNQSNPNTSAASTSVSVPEATGKQINEQIKTLDSLQQKTNPQVISSGQVQTQLNELDKLRSK